MIEPSAVLDGLRIVELCDGIAGPYCGKLLVDAGADVVKVEPPHGDALRRRAVHGEVLPDARDSALFRYLNAGKRSVVAEAGDLDALLGRADVLVEATPAGVLDIPALRRRHSHLVVVSITPYGRRTTWDGRPTNDFVVQAEAGGILGRGEPHEPPIQVGGRATEWIAGTYAGVGALALWRRSARSGLGSHLDLAMIESTNLTYTSFADLNASGVARTYPARRVERPSIESTRDGWIGFCAVTRAQFDSFLILIDRVDLVDDPSWGAAGRAARWEEWDEIVRSYTRTRTTAELVVAAHELRFPAVPVHDGASVLDHPQFRSRDFFATSFEGDFRHPRPPYRIDGRRPGRLASAPALGSDDIRSIGWGDRARGAPVSDPDADELPLTGIRVLDATAWWAGPSSTHLLACLGADVIHLESARRIDGARTVSAVNVGPKWWERTGLFLGNNTNKRDLTLDLEDPRGVELALRLIEDIDVVVENYSPRVFDRFGLTWERIHERNPRAVFVRMPAFGLDGPWRDSVGFAQTMEQLSGMAWVTGFADGQPRIPQGPCDPNAGTHAALAVLVALVRRDRTGTGCLVEATMAEAALNATAEQVVVASAYGIVPPRDGNRGPDASPQGVYRCTGDPERWLALSVENDDQWAALIDVLGRSTWATASALASADGRRSAADRIDEHLADWASHRDIESVVEQLIAAGIPAGEARDPRTMRHHPLLRERRFFEAVDHPVAGPLRVPSPPFRLDGVTRWHRRRPPLLGEHNAEILAELGVDAAEHDALERTGVASSTPPS